MKVVTIVGARPQFIKAAVVSRAIRGHNEEAGADSLKVREVIVHTGQHFDANMSQVFFQELALPQPDYHLGIGGEGHGVMTGKMMAALEPVLLAEEPDWVLVYGDTNSTLAGALVAAKLNIPIAHVEAGLRSFNRQMPEEINRILTDHLSSLLFCPTPKALENLRREGFERIVDLEPSGRKAETDRGPLPLVYRVGDVMYDAALHYGPKAAAASRILEELTLTPKSYILATVHRVENTDDPARLQGIFSGLARIAPEIPVVVPVHPRTRKALEQVEALAGTVGNLRLIDPVGYLDMIRLEQNARVILTDSGGIQKEAFFFGVPCVTLRKETEWVELVELGCNRLVDTDGRAMAQAVAEMGAASHLPASRAKVYGNGEAGKLILKILLHHAVTGRAIS